MTPFAFASLIGLAAWALTPKEPTTRVTLIPDADGKTGALVVRSQEGETLLDKPYLEAAASRQGALSTRQQDAASVTARYGAVLEARPQPPVSFTVYFEQGANRLTAESRAAFEKIKAELARRAAPEITVVGHTDRVGKASDNDALSRTRADTVRALLIEAGIEGKLIDTAGRGEREPLVPTADEVDEPKNRRVEISVR